MAKQVQHRRYDTATLAGLTPAAGEIMINTDTDKIHVGDGATAGGIPTALDSEVATLISDLNIAEAAIVTHLADLGNPHSVDKTDVALDNVLNVLQLQAASNLGDVVDAAAAFTAIKQVATESATGVVEIATAAEVATGTDTARSITPATLDGAISGKTDTTITASDEIAFADVSDSNKMKKDTLQGLLDLAQGAFETQLFHLRDEKASGTAGQALTTVVWTTRHLNTVATNEISGASVASNVITLPAGTYWVNGWATGKRVQKFHNALYNVTDAAFTSVIGQSANSQSTGNSDNVVSIFNGRVTIADEKDFKLQTYVQTTGTSGNGVSSGQVEVYADIQIWKVG